AMPAPIVPIPTTPTVEISRDIVDIVAASRAVEVLPSRYFGECRDRATGGGGNPPSAWHIPP
ncbi:MAG: hypothetical protein ACRDRV_09655, partial [Pseudonocardiaceae bacterium]